MTPSHGTPDEPTAPIDGMSLAEYVDVCRALIRSGGGSTHLIGEVLAAHGIARLDWVAINIAWTERIRRDPDVRAEFQRLYVVPTGEAVEPSLGNE